MRKYKGIDVSLWQGDVNWNKVKADGVSFAMIKASQGRPLLSDAGSPFTDPRFHRNANGAAAAGIMWGAYHYLCARNEAEAVREAEYFAELLRPFAGDMPLWAAVDVEDNGSLGALSRTELTAVVAAFCKTVKAAGLRPMVYASTWWLDSKFTAPAGVPLWEANLSIGARPSRARIWQYSFSGAVDGVNGDVDLNEGADIIGDANGDGKVDLADAAVMLKYAAGWKISLDRPQADANRDGRITAADAAEILRIIAGWK